MSYMYTYVMNVTKIWWKELQSHFGEPFRILSVLALWLKGYIGILEHMQKLVLDCNIVLYLEQCERGRVREQLPSDSRRRKNALTQHLMDNFPTSQRHVCFLHGFAVLLSLLLDMGSKDKHMASRRCELSHVFWSHSCGRSSCCNGDSWSGMVCPPVEESKCQPSPSSQVGVLLHNFSL